MKSMVSFAWRTQLLPVVLFLLVGSSLCLLVDDFIVWQRDNMRYQTEQQFYAQQSSLQQQGANAPLAALRQLRNQAIALNVVADELDYQILYRQWVTALKRFDQLRGAAENHYIATDLQPLRDKVQQLLLALRAECDKQLRKEPDSVEQQQWAIYNLRACVSIMMAYTFLEFDDAATKSSTFLGDAIEDFKRAIEGVDGSSAGTTQRMIPRWNLELIVGAGDTLLIGQGLSSGVNLEQLRSQLQAVVPNAGGYVQGDPIETRVRK